MTGHYHMKILQVVPDIRSESSGPSYSVVELTRALTSIGEDVELHFLDQIPASVQGMKIGNYPRRRFPVRSLGRSPDMFRGLREACRRADVIHVNSLWMMPNIYPWKAIQGTGCKIVVAPRGTLASWALNRSRWKKWIAWHLLGQKRVLQNASLFHATCRKECQEIRAAGFRQPVAIVPIGIDVPDVPRVHSKTRHLLFLGRLHSVKGVDRLLLAWERVCEAFPEWDFQIVGPDCGLKRKLEELVASRKIPRVIFQDEKIGKAKFECYSSADLYVLPSFTENFGITVAEALASGTPVIVSDQTPWEGVVSHGCGWFVDNSVESLAKQLEVSLRLERKELETMGENGKEWMAQSYSWKGVATTMQGVYSWLCSGGERPDCVVVD